MATDGRVSAKGIGGVEISERGFTMWHSDDRGGRWTFRIGGRSGLADLHRSEADGSKETLWVARTGELVGWLERSVTTEAVGPWLDAIARPVTWDWVRDRGVWLAPLPVLDDEDTERIARVVAMHPVGEAAEREPALAPSPLPLDLLPVLQPGAYLVYPGPGSDGEGMGALFRTPGLEGPELLWMDAEGLAERGERLLAPYRAELRAMDRPEVRAELARFVDGLRRGRS